MLMVCFAGSALTEDMKINLENIKPEDLEKFMKKANVLFHEGEEVGGVC